MDPGKRGVVTKKSTDGGLLVGDHIIFNSDGSITCLEAEGWIDAEDVASSMEGVEWEVDKVWIAQRKAKLLKEIKLLEEEQDRLISCSDGG